MAKLSPEEARAIWPTWPHGLNKRMAPEDLVDIEQEGESSAEQFAEALSLNEALISKGLSHSRQWLKSKAQRHHTPPNGGSH